MMSHDLLNDWDDTPEDEKEALLVLKTYHHLVYQLLHMDYLRNMDIIRQHCDISAYFDKHIKSGATPKECNDRILTFLEDRFSRHCEYDEFITILRKLVDMSHAQTILDQVQKKLKQCFAERRMKQKHKTAAGVAETPETHTSSTVNAVVDSKVKPVENGSDSKHQPTATVMKPESSASYPQKRSAHSVITGIISEKLYSTPGYGILESYKDRVCDSLPADYNSTAVKLQTLIGASDHMVQWVLTGDMSQVNHRIYQIVLVYVWCQPHFIKFCDIMEVLADDSITVGHIKALRKALIRHLYSDGHITAEQASHLESKKLFEASVTATPASTTAPTTTTADAAANTMLLSFISSSPTTATVTAISFARTCDVTVTTSDRTGNMLMYSSTTYATSSDIVLTAMQSITTTEVSPMSTHNVINAGRSMPQLLLSHKLETELPQCIESHSQPVNVATSECPPESDPVQSETPIVPSTAATNVDVPSTEETCSITQADIPVANEEDMSHPIVSVPIATSHDAIDSTTVHLASNQSIQDSSAVKTNDVETTRATAKVFIPAQLCKLPTTTASAKPIHPTTKEKPPLATLHSLNTKSSVPENIHGMLQAGVGAGDQSDDGLNQLIDFIVGSNLFSYTEIAYLCLTPQQERTKMLMEILAKIKESQDEVHSKVPDDGANAPVDKKDDPTLIGTEEICHILDNKDFAPLKLKYTEILTSLPEDFEATLGALQSSLSDSQICDILSLTTGHNQKILNCLITQLKKKEDLLDFCASLEKIPEAPPSLIAAVKELRKEVTEVLQAIASPEQPTTVSQTNQSKFITATTAPTAPHPEPITFHPTLRVIPLGSNPFDSCLLTDDNEGLAALQKCYPMIVENLPSNLLTTLLRLLDVANIPEEVVDNIVQSSCSKVGNKMIINYLIGLILTEEDIITFCSFVERMVGEFEKCFFILNLRNNIALAQPSKETSSDVTDTKTSSSATAMPDTSHSTMLPEKGTDIKHDSTSKCEATQRPSIFSLIRSPTSPSACRPYISDTGSMIGFLQCMIIGSNGGEYEESIKAVPPLERSSDGDQSNKEEGTPISSCIKNDFELVKDFINKDHQKEFVLSIHDAPGAQQSKQFYLNYIEVLFRESTKGGAWIYYTGYGEESTGNWCFKDGVITFQEIFALYNKYYKGNILYVYSDCCHSGQWVVECAKCLDEMGIGACGHQAKKNGILIKVYTSCQPTQKTTCNSLSAELLNFSDKDNCLYYYINKKISDSQTSYGCDFTKIMCMQVEGPTAPCKVPSVPIRCSWRWQDVIKIDNRPSSLLYTVRGKDKGRKAWHCVLIEKELLEEFNVKLETGTVDLSNYGYIICSGFGENPPDSISDKLKKYSPSYL